MNKEEALKLIQEKDTEDWHVVPTSEHETFLTNFKESEISKGIKEHVSSVHQKYDDTLREVLGKSKPVDVKTHEFLKSELLAMQDDMQSRQTKIDELEKAVKDKSGDEALKLAQSNYEALQKKYQKTMDEFKAEKENFQSEVNRVKLMNHADHALLGVKFLSNVPEDARKALIEIAKDDVVKDASFLNGSVVFLDEAGEPERDDQFNIVTMETKLKDKLKSIIDQGRKQGGVDIKEPVEKGEDGKVIVNVTVPDSVKNMEQLIIYLQEAGLSRNTDEYFEALKYWKEKLNFK